MEFWQVCRVLNNRLRLALVREIAQSPNRALNVVLAGECIGLQKSAASQYLKQLAGAGILEVERSGRFVICSGEPQEGAPCGVLRQELLALFDSPAVEERTELLFLKANALAHHGRQRILRCIAQRGACTVLEVVREVDMPYATVRRQVEMLAAAEILIAGELTRQGILYSVAPQDDPLAKVLVEESAGIARAAGV